MSLGTRWRRFWRSNDANAVEDLKNWSQSVMPDDIRFLFLKYFKEGNNLWLPAFKAPEPEYFLRVVSGLGATADGQIPLQSIILYLSKAHASKINVIQPAASLIETFVIAHAHFPFSAPVKLTEESFCRAILLLTDRCREPFQQAEGGASGGVSHEYIRKRPDERRLTFLHSALLRLNTGIPTQDDVLDVVCRVDYPAAIHGKDRIQRRPVSCFVPLAERLEPIRDVSTEDAAPVSQLKPLQDLVAAFPPRWTEPPADADYGIPEGLNAEQFVQWASRVQLLESLDQLFSVFLCPISTDD
ncbi:hypothetical protein SLS60_006806 [Paraconiothyrium brasiliense]|uniref:Uncharacterized protein n=1 Tax=Paraconiothyrium brasiliense TaxID=300254 RepID=A0ABR3R7L3_9PLEO